MLSLFAHQLEARLPLGAAGGPGEISLDDKPVAVLGEKVAGIRKAGSLTGRVLGKQSLRVGGGGMGIIAAALTMEIDAQVAVAARSLGNRALIPRARTLTSWSPATLLVLIQFLLPAFRS